MSPVQSPEFGTLLRHHRRAAGLSQEALAEKAGLSVEAIGVLERGRRHAPHAGTIRTLAKALGLSGQEHAALKEAAQRHQGTRASASCTETYQQPPLADLFPPSRPLPVPLIAPIGQERELDAVTALLRGGARLLALTGPGGAGKTLLALHAASAAQDLFPDGAAYVPLAALPDAAALAATHAYLLDARARGEQSLPENVVAPLRGKRRLLLIDNYERIASAAPLLADLCETCPDLTVLAISRAALRVRGVTELAVPPLALPAPACSSDIDEFAQCPAIQLFVRRARDVRPSFALTDADAGMVAEICRCLDGLPLAVELAAAHASMLSLPDLLEGLDQQPLDVLTVAGSPCDLPPRQRSLRASLDWSCDHLDPTTRVVLRRLAACTDGCTFEAATSACADIAMPAGGGDIFGCVSTLVDNHLLTIDHAGDNPHLTMPALARAYALQCLCEGEVNESGEECSFARTDK